MYLGKIVKNFKYFYLRVKILFEGHRKTQIKRTKNLDSDKKATMLVVFSLNARCQNLIG